CAIAPRRSRAMYRTIVRAPRASAAQSRSGGAPLPAPCPVTSAAEGASMRWVSGMPAAARPPIPEVIPGTTRNDTPAAASASASAAEPERVAALEADHARARGRQLDQALVDAQLRGPGAPRALADRLERRARAGQRQNLGRDQGIVQDDVGALERVRGVQR